MFDLRYHAISLVAVFLALGIGIVLGVSIGDSLLSEADRGLREGLREDVERARANEEAALDGLEAREELLASMLPELVGRRLRGVRVALVGVGSLPQGLEAQVREAVEQSGGALDSVSRLPADPAQLAGALGLRGEGEALDVNAAERVAAALTGGGRAAQDLRSVADADFAGQLGGADAVVFHGVRADDEDAAVARSWESGLIGAFREDGVEVVGVELSVPADLSQVPFYADEGIASVDNMDSAAGQAALVFALRGVRGRFGYDDGAEGALPEGRVVR